MSRYRNKISMLLTIALLLQVSLPGWLTLSGPVQAATLGPVLVSVSPADDMTNVAQSAKLTFTFDENVKKGSGSASITIYDYTLNQVFETYNVATDSRVSIDSTGRTVTVQPRSAFNLNTNYYVLMDPGTFVNVSNGANFSGIANAAEWNFKTIVQVDNTPPVLQTSFSPAAGATGVAITSKITLPFNEEVYAARGDIRLTSETSITAYDDRNIAVTSSQVTGSGTKTITITPSSALSPNTTYRITIPSGALQDAAGNAYGGYTWRFTTAPAPVNITKITPLDNATSVPVASKLVVTLDKEIVAAANKYIHLIRVSDNYDEKILANNTSRVSISGNTVTITPQKMLANTQYYVLIDAGAFVEKSTGEWFQGISNASAWDFTTDPGDEQDPPRLAATTPLSPAHNGVTGLLNTNLVMTFTEPVYPDSGNIEIRNVVNNVLFRSIPITSDNITGGGTNKITINPNKALYTGDTNKAFVNNSQYYVVIGNRALRDAAGNYFAGIAANSWTFRVTQDSVKPTLVSTVPVKDKDNVLTNATFYALFSETVAEGAGSIWIRPTVSATAPSILTSYRVDPNNDKQIIITLPTGRTLESNTSYYVEISPDAVVDLAGNAYDGIQNQYQWAFKTIGDDITPPVVSKLEYSGNIITMTFNEELNENSIPSLSNFYITVNGALRTVTAVSVSGLLVKVTLSSAIVNGQEVKLSYSKPSNGGGIQDLVYNQAGSISNSTVSALVDTAAAAPVGGSISGNIVTVTFNKDLSAASSSAYQQFSIFIDGTYYSPTSLYVSGRNVLLTFNGTYVTQQAVYVTYSAGSYPIKDSTGTNIASFTRYNITGSSTDTKAPTLFSAIATGSTIILQYSEALNTSSVPSTSSYSVSVNSSLRTVTQVRISGEQVILSLASAVASGDLVYVSYGAGTPRVTDLAGNSAASFTTVNATVGSSTGMLAAAVAKGTKLTLTYNQTLSSSYTPTTSQFLVQANSTTYPVTSVVVSGNAVSLTLSSSVGIGSTVTLSYYSSSAGLRTLSGTVVESVTSQVVSNQTSILDSLSGDYEEIAGGGIGLTTSAATTSYTTSPAGTYAYKYAISADKITTAYQAARTLSQSNQRVVFTVPSSEAAAIVSVPVSALQSATYYGTSTVFGVKYGSVSYDIPLNAINFSDLSKLLNSNGLQGDLLIEIDQGTSTLTSSLTSAISKANATLLSSPVSFEVSVSYGGAKQAVTSFSGYVTRTIETSNAVTAKTAAVVWYDPQAGALSYVPTTFTTSGSKTVATFKRKGNSAYALVRGTSSFSDIGKHWAGTTIESLARKYIVDGRSSTKFEPEKSITRGEFASFIAKGLGLTGNKTAAAKFKDVSTSSAVAAYIGAASDAGIVLGNTDGTFKPNSYITRQEMAVMMTRAAKTAGTTVTLPSTTTSYLQKFTDRGKVSSWAQNDVAKAIYTGVITGKTTTTFSPTTNATRAEAVVMIKRLLEYVDFLAL